VVLEKLDGSCEERRGVTRAKEERNIIRRVKERKARYFGHVVRKNRILKHLTGGEIKGSIEVSGK
jgi:hypothetical protein